MDAITEVPVPANEPVRQYEAGSAERATLQTKLKDLAAEQVELTMTIGGEQRSGGGDEVAVVQPHKRSHVLGLLRNATEADARAAVDAAKEAAPRWRALSFEDRAAIFLKAADLLSGPWRDTLNAASMLGQSKTAIQAEIDAACELIDFWRFNVAFAREILAEQPQSAPGVWNRLDHRPLEGFVYAITPFNFTAIAGNLPTAPALMGNVVLWKPSPTQQLAAHFTMRLLEEAGLPPGVINMLPGNGLAVSDVVLANHRLHRHFPEAVAHHRGKHVDLSDLSPDRRGDRWQGLRGRSSFGRSGRASDRLDPGGVRISGPEMFSRVQGVRAAIGVGADERGPHRRDRIPADG